MKEISSWKKEQRQEIVCFLSECKKIITSGGAFVLLNREKNVHALAVLELTKKDCVDILLGLTVDDYHSGPNEDTDRPGEVWIFGKDIGTCEVYIKLKIIGSDTVKCISFHRAEYPLTHPRGE